MMITNNLSGKKENFEPLKKGKIKMYVCGITPYDLSHIGHARTYVSFDMIRRYLERTYDVDYTVNVTDVDDKIIKRANENNVDPLELAESMTKLFINDMDALKVHKPTHMPKVSESINDITEFIRGLIEKGYAYELDGDVYFDVSKFEEYGKLSGNKTEALAAGARIEPNPSKRNPGDFALWKAAKPGEPSWKSPWSSGRPGWHIECSAMNRKIFGDQIDIHGGGMDLKFPHHENEIAQSEALSGKQFAKYWMHTGFLTVDGEKMSKSLGNFITIQDALKKWSPEAMRLLFLKTHYRSPLDFSEIALNEATDAQRRLQDAFERVAYFTKAEGGSDNKEVASLVEKALVEFESAMDDDFSSTEALAVVFSFTRDVNKILDSGKFSDKNLKTIVDFYETVNSIFGIISYRVEQEDVPQEIMDLVEERELFRKDRNFEEADNKRDEIRALGYDVEDTPRGPRVRKI